MLVSNKYPEGSIVTFKLVNGDEVVAKVVNETPSGFTVVAPYTVMPSQQGIGILPSLFTTEPDGEITISRSHIMLHAPTFSHMVNHYLHTVTGIEPITAGDIIV